jgi:hypothetical protein
MSKADETTSDRVSWVDSPNERKNAARVLSWSFALSFLAIVATGAFTLLSVPLADVDLDDLAEKVNGLNCLRVARRADYPVVFVSIGSPAQYLKLVLRLDHVVQPEEDSVFVFAERLHKSQTMQCEPFDPPIPFRERCSDVALLYNGTTVQSMVHTRFTFSNDYVEQASEDRAALVGLDGYVHLVAGTSYFLTNTHLCFGTYEPTEAPETLAFETDSNSKLRSKLEDIQNYEPTSEVPVTRANRDDCENVTYSNDIEIFPADAISESTTWLTLSSNFLFEYGNSVIERRREAIEVGEACARERSDLSHIHALYRLDCDILYPNGHCRTDPALPFRRLAQSRLRLDIDADGKGTLLADHTDALARIPYLVSYGEGLKLAFGRLLIMLLTAAVVFIRGNQNASSSSFMLKHVFDTIRCRKKISITNTTDLSWAFAHDHFEIGVDVAITVVALISRVLVFGFVWRSLVADNHARVIAFELVGISASLAHILLRYVVLKCDLSREAPLTKLAGPMSICDVSAAVLLAFSDPPLLSTDDGRFAAVGRLLIAMLIAIQVFSRCAFAASMTALMAKTVVNDKVAYRDLKGYRTVLIVACALWILQGCACSASMCSLFVNPAAYTMTRLLEGDTSVYRFCIFFGLTAASLPTITKVALRTLEHECESDRQVVKAQ